MQLVGNSFFGGGLLASVGMDSIIGVELVGMAVGMGVGKAAGIAGDGVCGGVMVIWMVLLASTSGLPPTATTPFSVHVLSNH